MADAPARPGRPGAAAGTAAAALTACVTALLVAGAPATAAAQETGVFRTSRRDAGQVDRMSVSVDYVAGRLRISPAGSGVLYRQSVSYEESRFTPERSWRVEDGGGEYRFELRATDTPLFRLDWLDLEVDLGGLMDLEEASGRMDFRLGREVPTDLDVQVGAAEVRAELGGIPLRSVRLETGASDTRIRFSRPNPLSMRRLVIRAGAASLHADRLGNARFRELSVEGGVGDLRVDFRGDWTGDATGTLKMGMGSMTLIFPPDLGVEVRRRSFLTAVDASGFRRDGSTYRSPNWESARHRLRLYVEAALGSVDLRIQS